ncbi:MAG: FAD-dependent oxidoreductase [Candidatus Aminicenantales bacterium]
MNASDELFDVAVIGGGVVGCAVLRELSRYRLRAVLLEKESDLCEGISKGNSGVIHAGFNVRTGSLKAWTNLSGLKTIYALAAALHVPHRKTGKLVVAFDEDGRERLEQLRAQGDRNGAPGLEIVDEAAIRKLAPDVRGKWALFSPWTGIISPYEFTIALAESAFRNGAEIRLSRGVTAVDSRPDRFVLSTPFGKVSARWVVNCAGLWADDVAGLAGSAEFRVHPYKGEYLILDKAAGEILRMPIYPVPPRDESSLGIHITPTTEGPVLLGPSSDFVDDKNEATSTRPVMDMLKAEAFQMVPALSGIPVIHAYSGLRPKLIGPGTADGSADFLVAESDRRPRWINFGGIESPGLTAAPALGEMAVGLIGAKEDLRLKPDFEPGLPARLRFAHMDDDARTAAAAADPEWGEMVCRCEHVARAEVRAALRNPFGADSMDAIKRRTRCGMGRCQGGFCGPRLIEILQAEGLKPEDITKRGGSSRLVFGRIKP